MIIKDLTPACAGAVADCVVGEALCGGGSGAELGGGEPIYRVVTKALIVSLGGGEQVFEIGDAARVIPNYITLDVADAVL